MYTTDEKVKDFNNVPSDVGTTEIKQHIKIVSAFMDKEVGYKIASLKDDPTRTLYFDGSGTDVVDLGSKWINQFTAIMEDGVDITEQVLAYPMNESYKNQLVMKIGNFCETPGGISITEARVGAYHVDWKEPEHTLPEDLQHACNVLVGSIIRLKKAGGQQAAGKITSEKTSQYAITFGEGVAGEMGADEVSAMQTLALYRDHFIA